MATAGRIHKDLRRLFKATVPDCILSTQLIDHTTPQTHDSERKDMSEVLRYLTEDDTISLNQVRFFLLGPECTPYYDGCWKVELKIPNEYPEKPPKAFFMTKIFHPNVDPNTGEVCVDTLKRGWNPKKVDLVEILQTIRCLLIQPNPESALNEEAGKLLLQQEEEETATGSEFEKKVRVMTRVHAIQRKDIVRWVIGHSESEEKSKSQPTVIFSSHTLEKPKAQLNEEQPKINNNNINQQEQSVNNATNTAASYILRPRDSRDSLSNIPTSSSLKSPIIAPTPTSPSSPSPAPYQTENIISDTSHSTIHHIKSSEFLNTSPHLHYNTNNQLNRLINTKKQQQLGDVQDVQDLKVAPIKQLESSINSQTSTTTKKKKKVTRILIINKKVGLKRL